MSQGPAPDPPIDEAALIAEYEAEKPARSLSGLPHIIVQGLAVGLTGLALWWVFRPMAAQFYLLKFCLGRRHGAEHTQAQ